MEQSAAFVERERALREVRDRLCEALPCVREGTRGFSWIMAADYFTCRLAHDLPLLEGATESDLLTALEQTEWRFGRFYATPFIRAHAVGPLLSEVLGLFNARALRHSSHRLALFSGHDVTLLPLLRALTGNDQHSWPRYASCLELDLLRHQEQREQLFVRARYNDEPLRITGCDGHVCSLHHFARLVQQERMGRSFP